MTRILLLAACVALSGCASLPGGSGQMGAALQAVVTDPRCSHDDELEGITGAAGVPASLHFKVARHCPAVTGQSAP